MADHDESNLPEDSDTAATPSTEPQPASPESQNVEQQAAPQEEALDESDAADQPESSTEDVVADGSSLSEQEEADADTADNSEDDEEPDVSPGDYVVMDPIPDLIKLPLPEDPEIIEPHQPPALGGDGPESSEPVVFDVSASAAAAVKESQGQPAAPLIGERVTGIPALENVEIHGKPIVRIDTADDAGAASAGLDVIDDRAASGHRDDAVEPLVVEVFPVEAIEPDEPEGSSPAGHQSVDTYLASEEAKSNAAEEPHVSAVPQLKLEQPLVSRVDAAQLLKPSLLDESEADEEGADNGEQLLMDVEWASKADLIETEELGNANIVAPAVDTNKLADVSRLVNENLQTGQVDVEQLSSLLGGMELTPDANSLVSEGGVGLPKGGTYTQTTTSGSTTTHEFFEVVVPGDADDVVISKKTGSAEVWNNAMGAGTAQTAYKDAYGNVIGTTMQGTIDGVTTVNITVNMQDGSRFSTVTQTDALGNTTVVTTTRDQDGNVTSQTTEDKDGNKTDTTGNAQNGQSQGSSDSDDSDDDDDDDDDDDSDTQEDTAADDATDSQDEASDDDGEAGEEGTPNPMNEPSGPPLVFVTEGRLGQDQMSIIEKGIHVAGGGGHTDPVEDSGAEAPLEFLTSEVGAAQFKADQQAIESATSGGVTDPPDTQEASRTIPNLLDFERIGFIAGGGGVVDPPQDGGGSGSGGGIISGGGTLQEDDDPDDPESASTLADLVGSLTSDDLSIEMLSSDFIAQVDTSGLRASFDADLAERIKEDIEDDIS